MATLTGNDGQVVISGTTLAAVRNFSIEMTRDTVETTVMGTDVRTYLAGLWSYSGSADIYFDTSDLMVLKQSSIPLQTLLAPAQ